MIEPGTLILLTGLGAVVGLDFVSFPQAMLSRPIVAATLAGAICGNAAAGLLAGALLAFALSFDEVIVTTFTAGQQTTLPIWMLQELIRPRQRPVTNVVAVVIIALTFVPIVIAYTLTRADEPGHR